MNYYIVTIIQLMIYSGYTLIEHLSGKDHLLYNTIMFIVFFYLSFILAKNILKTFQKTIITTLISLGTYGLIYEILNLLF